MEPFVFKWGVLCVLLVPVLKSLENDQDKHKRKFNPEETKMCRKLIITLKSYSNKISALKEEMLDGKVRKPAKAKQSYLASFSAS